MPRKVEKTMQILSKIHCGLTMSTIEVIDSEGKVIPTSPNLENVILAGAEKAKYGGCTMAFDRHF